MTHMLADYMFLIFKIYLILNYNEGGFIEILVSQGSWTTGVYRKTIRNSPI